MPRRRRPSGFWVSGVPLDSPYWTRRLVRWERGRVRGDAPLIAATVERASALRYDLSDPVAALAILTALFFPSTIERGGNLPG